MQFKIANFGYKICAEFIGKFTEIDFEMDNIKVFGGNAAFAPFFKRSK